VIRNYVQTRSLCTRQQFLYHFSLLSVLAGKPEVIDSSVGLAASIRSVRWSSSALIKDVAQMLPEEKLGVSPREAMCAVGP